MPPRPDSPLPTWAVQPQDSREDEANFSAGHENRRTAAFAPLGERLAIPHSRQSWVRGFGRLFPKQIRPCHPLPKPSSRHGPSHLGRPLDCSLLLPSISEDGKACTCCAPLCFPVGGSAA